MAEGGQALSGGVTAASRGAPSAFGGRGTDSPARRADLLRTCQAKPLRMAGELPMDAAVVPCELVRMDVERSRLPDEVHGARAAGSIVVGDLAEAEAELACARTRYLAGFLMRLALVVPSVSVRLAWRVAIRRCRWSKAGDWSR